MGVRDGVNFDADTVDAAIARLPPPPRKLN
jgi:hypothetical protein